MERCLIEQQGGVVPSDSLINLSQEPALIEVSNEEQLQVPWSIPNPDAETCSRDGFTGTTTPELRGTSPSTCIPELLRADLYVSDGIKTKIGLPDRD